MTHFIVVFTYTMIVFALGYMLGAYMEYRLGKRKRG